MIASRRAARSAPDPGRQLVSDRRHAKLRWFMRGQYVMEDCSVDRSGDTAWMGAVGAGIVLDVLMIPLVYPFMAATPDWGAFAESLGFAAVGTVMIFVLFGASRSKADDRPQPGDLPSSTIA